MESTKDKFVIIGMGCTRFGDRWDVRSDELAIETACEAYEDAGVDPRAI
jgi:acetyl-CoA C-acetyltransferase